MRVCVCVCVHLHRLPNYRSYSARRAVTVASVGHLLDGQCGRRFPTSLQSTLMHRHGSLLLLRRPMPMPSLPTTPPRPPSSSPARVPKRLAWPRCASRCSFYPTAPVASSAQSGLRCTPHPMALAHPDDIAKRPTKPAGGLRELPGCQGAV